MNHHPVKVVTIVVLLCLPMLAMALSNKQVALYASYVPAGLLVLWILKRIFFKDHKISKWVPITVLIVFGIGLVLALVRGKQEPVDVFSDKFVKLINENAPTMVDENKRIDQASYQKPVLTLDITMVNIKPNEYTPQQLMDALYLEEKKGVCESNEIVFAMNGGVKLIYVYSDNQGNRITELDFDKLSCSQYTAL